ncbi:MAG: hypothetical protein ABJF10_24155 [Chthoniobacter sp.]|uniref:hypothetical protein n=1 Tax=Chthoniobacter sp. TaxID=2510640 RepID=UPI0032AD097B
MADKEKKSGCLSTIFKAFAVVILISVIAALLEKSPETAPDKSTSQTDESATTKPSTAIGAPSNAATPSKPPTTGKVPSQPQKPPVPIFDISKVADNELPKQVTLKASESFSIPASSGTVTVPGGSRVELLRRSGEILTLRFLSGQRQLHYAKTNFADQVQIERAQRIQMEQARKEQLARAQRMESEAMAAKAAAESARLKAEVGEKPINSPWDGGVLEVERYLKARLKDPKSTEYIEWSPVTLMTFKDGKAWAVRVKYRSKNSFRGYVIEEAVAIIRHGEVVEFLQTK